jgi:hypothetical protein
MRRTGGADSAASSAARRLNDRTPVCRTGGRNSGRGRRATGHPAGRRWASLLTAAGASVGGASGITAAGRRALSRQRDPPALRPRTPPRPPASAARSTRSGSSPSPSLARNLVRAPGTSSHPPRAVDLRWREAYDVCTSDVTPDLANPPDLRGTPCPHGGARDHGRGDRASGARLAEQASANTSDSLRCCPPKGEPVGSGLGHRLSREPLSCLPARTPQRSDPRR